MPRRNSHAAGDGAPPYSEDDAGHARAIRMVSTVRCSRGRSSHLTKRGKPVAKVVAVDDRAHPRPLRGSVRHRGDIVAPVDERWDAVR